MLKKIIKKIRNERSLDSVFRDELSFWDEHLQIGKRHPWMEEVISPQTRKKQFPDLLLPCLEEMRKKSKRVRLLDMGCGPISRLAWGVEQRLFTITAVDPLAEEYIDMLNKHRISFPIKPIQCKGEELAKFFAEEAFDIVYSSNSLDHVFDVSQCIENIYTVLRKDGIFLLEGFVKEGTHNNWTGLHQHDLILINGDLVHLDKIGKMTKLLSGFDFDCIYQNQRGTQPGDWYDAIFKKS